MSDILLSIILAGVGSYAWGIRVGYKLGSESVRVQPSQERRAIDPPPDLKPGTASVDWLEQERWGRG